MYRNAQEDGIRNEEIGLFGLEGQMIRVHHDADDSIQISFSQSESSWIEEEPRLRPVHPRAQRAVFPGVLNDLNQSESNS